MVTKWFQPLIEAPVGFSILGDKLDAVQYDPRNSEIKGHVQRSIPAGIFGTYGDIIHDTDQLALIFAEALTDLGVKGKNVHFAIPATVLRQVEMPKIEKNGLYLSLSSEAEGYKAFDGSEACVSFSELDGASSANLQKLIFSAIRKDTLAQYKKAFQKAKIKAVSMEPEELSVIRAMAGTGVLDNLIQQLGNDPVWGSLFASNDRLRYLVWKGNQLVEMREVQMPTNFDGLGNADSYLLEDLIEETSRTVKTSRVEPKIWLTHHLPEAIQQAMSNEFGIPVRACLAAPTVQGASAGVDLAALGAALRKTVDFPFGINLTGAKSEVKSNPNSILNLGKKEDEESLAESEEDAESYPWAVPGAIVIAVITLLAYAGLYFWNATLTSEVTKLQDEQTILSQEQSNLLARVNDLKAKYQVNESIVQVARKAGEKNTVVVGFVKDLARLTPPDIWIYDIGFTSTLKLLGKTTDHKTVIDFSKYFEKRPYLTDVSLETMQEDMIGPNPVYSFSIGGRIAPPYLPASGTAVGG